VRRLITLALLVLLAGPAEGTQFKGQLGPSTLTAGYGAAWVGFGNGAVWRIDEHSLERTSQNLDEPGSAFVSSLAAGLGSIWVAPNSTPVYRLDPRTGRVRSRIWNQPSRWSGRSSQVAVGAGFVWVLDSERNAVMRVDPRTNRVVRRRAFHDRLLRLGAGPSGVWVQTAPGRGASNLRDGPRIISRLEVRTLRVRRAFRVKCDSLLHPARRALWVLETCDGSVRRYDPRSGDRGDPIATRRDSWGLTAGFGSIWVTTGATVTRIRGGRIVAEIRARGPYVAAGERLLWVLDLGNGGTGWLRRIDPAMNRLVGRPIRLSARQ
jgi:hypothetical protein